ncbi:MAG: ChbG/HpnK family deacetylase [Elusimicrobiota bacterium]
MKKLIVNADDFGYKEGINKGIIYAHKSGVVTSASLFVEKEGTEEAVRLAKENPSLGMGPHIDIDQFFNVDHHFGIIVEMSNPKPNADTIRSEIKRQLDKFFSFGFTADHLDSHHHSHLHPEVFPIICEIAKEYKVPVVRFFSKFYSDSQVYESMKKILSDNGLVFIDQFIEGWYWGNVDESYQIAELMTHPGYAELWREAELAHCCQPQLKQYLIDQKIDLLRFSDIAGK